MNKEVIIIGAGGHGKVVADIVRKSNDIVYGFLDDDEDCDTELLGQVIDCEKYSDKYFFVAIGDNIIRKKNLECYPDFKYYTAIHPNAIISENVVIGEGTCVMANAVINDSAQIGNHCIINTHATVEHDDVIEDFVHISPGATLCGTVHVGECTWICAGATVKNNTTITSNCIIGMCAAVLHDIDEAGVYVGIPAGKEAEIA